MSTNKNKLVIYTASWCQACPAYIKMVEASGIPHKVVDADEEGAVKEILKLGARSVPVTVLYEGSQPVYVGTGSDALADVKKIMEK